MEASNQKTPSPDKKNSVQDSIPSDEEYEESLDDEIEVPDKNAVSEAIYQKYQNQLNKPLDSVIKQADEEEETEKPPAGFKFRIKNLDTGEELQIENEEME